MKMPVAQNQFSNVANRRPPRSTFKRDNVIKTAFDASRLVPIFVDEVLPGDTHEMDLTAFARLSTPIVPIMDNLELRTAFFFVPSRILWTNFERFMGAQDNPEDSTDFLMPRLGSIPETGFDVGTIYDFMGLPVNSFPPGVSMISLPFRAYNLIWNQFFRDQNLQESAPVPTGDGPDNLDDGLFRLRRVNKKHDYFTSSLPFPQKGDPVGLPLGGQAPVVLGDPSMANVSTWVRQVGGAWVQSPGGVPNGTVQMGSYASGLTGVYNANQATPGIDIYDPEGVYFADLSQATAATINDLREAISVQHVFELDARGGSRYVEHVLNHWHTVLPDFRAQRPEYLGGGVTPILFQPVAQTAPTQDGVTPQGNLAATATAAAVGHRFNKTFVEHGYIIGLAWVRAELSYSQGIDRMWLKRTRFSHYLPALANLGEQEIFDCEIFADGQGLGTFSFQERWAEYRYKNSKVTGKMRPGVSGSLAIWNLSELFGAAPLFNSDFIVDRTFEVLQRSLAVNDEPQILFDGFCRYKSHRMMPVYSIPGLDRI